MDIALTIILVLINTLTSLKILVVAKKPYSRNILFKKARSYSVINE